MKFNSYLNDITIKIDDYTEDNSLNEIKSILIEMSLDQAIEFAEEMHKGQVRKGNQKPYVVHPKAVYQILKSFNVKDKILLVAAWLHDTIEDTTATYNIIKRKFNKEVADLVKAVSSVKKDLQKVGKAEYLLKKMLSMKTHELTLKLADRLHNITDISSMSNGQKVYDQTMYILQGIKEGRTLTGIQKKLIRAIEKILNKSRFT
jgi:guanosine-3',5'-bis(diphosphate) 3'-pyrophosphohydrolase